jgi:hypothetical protein
MAVTRTGEKEMRSARDTDYNSISDEMRPESVTGVCDAIIACLFVCLFLFHGSGGAALSSCHPVHPVMSHSEQKVQIVCNSFIIIH